MTSLPVRDPTTDHLLTPQDSVPVIVDYQPLQVTFVASMDRHALVGNIDSVARLARLFGVPTLLSTVNVATGKNPSTIHQLCDVLPDVQECDRTQIHVREDQEFQTAVKAQEDGRFS